MLLITFVSAYPPTCSPIFGQPDTNDCNRVLRRNPIAHSDINRNRGGSQLFGIAGLPRPEEISGPQWLNRVAIPKFFSYRESSHCYHPGSELD